MGFGLRVGEGSHPFQLLRGPLALDDFLGQASVGLFQFALRIADGNAHLVEGFSQFGQFAGAAGLGTVVELASGDGLGVRLQPPQLADQPAAGGERQCT